MRAILIFALFVLFTASCDVPQQIQNTPNGTTNTSGTTGSARMTEKPTAAGTGTADTTAKKDSIPH